VRDVTEIERLAKAIRDLHDVDAEHLRSEPVREVFRGRIVWDGVVESVRHQDAPEGRRAYAWSHETDAGGRRSVAILGVDPIRTAQDAVRVAIAARRVPEGAPFQEAVRLRRAQKGWLWAGLSRRCRRDRC